MQSRSEAHQAEIRLTLDLQEWRRDGGKKVKESFLSGKYSDGLRKKTKSHIIPTALVSSFAV
jgi:hypothetical protein